MENEVNEVSSNNQENPILDIVSAIQNKLNNENVNANTNANNTNINNIENKQNNGLDVSKIVDILKGLDNKQNSESSVSPQNSNSGLDLGTLMNLGKTFGGFGNNKTDPRQNLLNSLKPFLRENRQKNIDTYISLLGIMKTFNIFTNKDRD